LLAVSVQIYQKKFHPVIYWITIIATTTVGTTLADFVNRSIGIGYTGGTLILSSFLMASLFIWHRTLGTVSINTIATSKQEIFYWITIMFSQTLGTALGDWTADSSGLGYLLSAVVFSTSLMIVAGAYYWSSFSRTLLFWAAFILTRPLGAVVGDFLDKPVSHGGLDLSRYSASFILLLFIALCIKFSPSNAAQKSH